MDRPLRPGNKLHGYMLTNLISPDSERPHTVWRALTKRGEVVVVKLADRRHGDSQPLLQNEAKILNELEHGSIPGLLTSFTTRRFNAIVLTRMPGMSLDKWPHLRPVDGQAPPTDTAYVMHITRIIRRLAGILAYVHDRGIVHCDIKPANVMLDEQGSVSLIDFGIARYTGNHLQGMDSLGMYGTPVYAPPEMYLGERLEPRSDLYMLGVLGYRLLSGQVPLYGETAQEIGFKRVHYEPEPLLDSAPWLPDDLAELIMRCVQRLPFDRPLSAHELLRSIDRLPA